MSRTRVYPLNIMEPGDSFVCPLHHTRGLSASLHDFRQSFPERKFITKTINGMRRCWRVDGIGKTVISQIDKNVPVPPIKNWKRYTSLYPFRNMEIGDSFVVRLAVVQRIRELVSRHHKRYGLKFIVRKENETQWRCWRVE